MGSFNETCALSNLNISPGTPVRLLFLTRNPYVDSDQREDHRGVYHNDHWFVRTPPIKGKYADYGRCDFKECPITDLICHCFEEDVVERPFGFNQYHACDVTKTKGIYHFVQAAFQGRLLVKDHVDTKEVPDSFPTWQKVHEILKKAKLPLQYESKLPEGKKGYNAQPVIPGVVCVTFNSYDDHMSVLNKAKEVLGDYDCRIVNRFDDRAGYACLMVVPKGTYEIPSTLCDEDDIIRIITTYPGMHHETRQLPVLAVMIREDVWQTYCKVQSSVPDPWGDWTVKKTLAAIKKNFENLFENENLAECYSEIAFRDVLNSLTFQTTPSTHLLVAKKVPPFPAKDELLRGCAELARIEHIMSKLGQCWYIPPLGGQNGSWSLRTELLKKITKISEKEAKEDHAN